MIFKREKRTYQSKAVRKRIEKDLRKLAAEPCAANVFPREKPGCENNGDLCASCDARNELDKLIRQSNSLILNRAKAKLLTCGWCGKSLDDDAQSTKYIVSILTRGLREDVAHHGFVYGTNGPLT